MQLIKTITVGPSGIGIIDFNFIPNTFTDLVLVASLRDTANTPHMYISFNDTTAGYTMKQLIANGSTTTTAARTDAIHTFVMNPADSTPNTFNNFQMYIGNYASSSYKVYSTDAVTENYATGANSTTMAGLWSNTAAIVRVSFGAVGVFAPYSSVSLYGIVKGSGGATVA